MVSPTCPIPHHPRNDVPNLSCPTAPLKQCPQPAPSCSTPEPMLPICPVPKHPRNDVLNLSHPIAPQNDVLNLSHPTAPRNDVPNLSRPMAPRNDVPNLSCPAAPLNPCPQPALSHSTPCARHNLSPQGDTDRDRTLTTTPTFTRKSHPLTHPHVSPPKPVSRGVTILPMPPQNLVSPLCRGSGRTGWGGTASSAVTHTGMYSKTCPQGCSDVPARQGRSPQLHTQPETTSAAPPATWQQHFGQHWVTLSNPMLSSKHTSLWD